ncbi:hypothetical protein GGS23DRAFT_371444 [Durotheca rogersii]|uniref:uncharacterized protein n=1 Tax=Durotheca rogersii TaxID=419775 RepID=UPI00221EA0A5|nr:uncharacterized protein GGS23DRAFT_371444 [Durotheca rogersii]KAI5866152.1 hypothetical protein GGS23DRAFT_371444 [Durotheca rogersii]
MNWYWGSTATATAPAPAKSEGKKLRKKLQKIGSQQRWFPTLGHHDTKKAAAANAADTSKRAISEIPNPDDGKWLEQLRKSGYLCRDSAPPVQQPHDRKPLIRHSTCLVPELAHLTLDDARSGRPLDRRASCAVPSLSSSVTRQYAKTPVHRIGQLEDRAGRDPPALRKVSSIEQIAESYRELLKSSCAILNDTPVEPPSPLHLREPYHADVRIRAGHETIHELPEVLPLAMGSPTSDDGTLVASDADSASLQRRRYSPEPASPRENRLRKRPAAPLRKPPSVSPSLQICFDLLARELSSAANGSSLRPSAETSALQVWVMIEAYERLRDQVLDMRLSSDQEHSLDAMIDTWLKALYAVHDKMMGHDGAMSESDYGD